MRSMPFGYTTHNRLMILLWCFALPLCLIEVIGVHAEGVLDLRGHVLLPDNQVGHQKSDGDGRDADDLDEAEWQGEAPKQDHQPVVGGVAEGHGAAEDALHAA